ncbi:MAG: thermonuclease family protein [Candidatus Diapherotrites archaeon]
MVKKKKSKLVFFVLILVVATILLLVTDPELNLTGLLNLEKTPVPEPIPEGNLVFVSRVIDGDTIELAGGDKVRLLGINTPESNEVYYSEAKERAIDLMEKKTCELIFGDEKTDKYGRLLAFVECDKLNVNLQIVREGFATVYLSAQDDLFFNELNSEQEFAERNEKGLWEKSEWIGSECVELIELNEFDEYVKFKNSCEEEIDLIGISVKDAGRNKYVFEEFVLGSNEELILHTEIGVNSGNEFYWNSNSNIWNNDFDSLFVRDSKGKLVLFYEY